MLSVSGYRQHSFTKGAEPAWLRMKVAQLCPTLCNPMNCSPLGSSAHGILQASTRVGSHSLLQGIFLTQESNLAFLHCRWILHHMSRQGSPLSTVLQSNSVLDYTVHGILQARVLEWVAVPFSRGSSQPRNWTQVSRLAQRFSWCTLHTS